MKEMKDKKMPLSDSSVVQPLEDAKPELRDLSGTFVRFENPGDSVEGLYIGWDIADVADAIKPQFKLGDPDTGEIRVFNGTAGLTRDFARIQLGTYVKVTFQRKERTGKGFYVNVFKVQIDASAKLLPRGESLNEMRALRNPMGDAPDDTVEITTAGRIALTG